MEQIIIIMCKWLTTRMHYLEVHYKVATRIYKVLQFLNKLFMKHFIIISSMVTSKV